MVRFTLAQLKTEISLQYLIITILMDKAKHVTSLCQVGRKIFYAVDDQMYLHDKELMVVYFPVAFRPHKNDRYAAVIMKIWIRRIYIYIYLYIYWQLRTDESTHWLLIAGCTFHIRKCVMTYQRTMSIAEAAPIINSKIIALSEKHTFREIAWFWKKIIKALPVILQSLFLPIIIYERRYQLPSCIFLMDRNVDITKKNNSTLFQYDRIKLI